MSLLVGNSLLHGDVSTWRNNPNDRASRHRFTARHHLGMLRGDLSEWCASSSRNGARDQIGMLRAMSPDSAIKGGRLAAATKARVVSLIVSDVPGDSPAFVASGPTIPDSSTRHDALDVIQQYQLALPDSVMAHLRSESTPAPSAFDPVFARHEHHIIASAGVSLRAGADLARSRGLSAAILSDSIEGEARDVGSTLAAIARQIGDHDQPFSKPVVLLSGGETTVSVAVAAGAVAIASLLLPWQSLLTAGRIFTCWRRILTALMAQKLMLACTRMEQLRRGCVARA